MPTRIKEGTCCCTKLTIWGLVIAFVQIFTSLVLIISTIAVFSKRSNSKASLIFVIVWNILNASALVFGVFLLMGTLLKRPAYVLAHLISTVVLAVVCLAVAIYSFSFISWIATVIASGTVIFLFGLAIWIIYLLWADMRKMNAAAAATTAATTSSGGV